MTIGVTHERQHDPENATGHARGEKEFPGVARGITEKLTAGGQFWLISDLSAHLASLAI